MVPWAAQQEAASDLAAYRALALEPSGLPRPLVAPGPLLATTPGLTGTATLLDAEQEAWNRWTDGGPRLFNNRIAHLFRVEVVAPDGSRWVPSGTLLELNSPEVQVGAAESPEAILADLTWFALQQERWVLDGDLVARTRGAGRFRSVYLSPTDQGHAGLLAFPLFDGEQQERRLDTLHVVGMRLTMAIEVEGQLEELVWVFD